MQISNCYSEYVLAFVDMYVAALLQEWVKPVFSELDDPRTDPRAQTMSGRPRGVLQWNDEKFFWRIVFVFSSLYVQLHALVVMHTA